MDLVIECFLCGNLALLKKDKKGKPYFYCDDCKLRVFVGSEKGARLLVKKAVKK